MTKDFNYITSRGLPGGPNQEITYVTGVFSVEGYRYDSPDKNNSVNLIESGNISMSENDGSPLKKGPLLGIDNLGNKEVMIPGTNYSFPGNQVLEIPMAQKGNGEFRDFKGIPFLSSIAAGDFANHQHHNSRLADLYRYYSGRPLEDNILQVSNTKPTKAKDPDVKYISLNKNQQLVQEVIDNYNRISNGNFYTNKTRPDLILDADDNEKQLDENNYKVTGYREVDDIDDYQLNAIGNYFTGFGEDENGIYISYYDKFDQAGGLGGSINFGEKLGLTKPFEIYDRIYVEKDKDSGKYIQKKKEGDNKKQDGGCTSCTESMRQREGSYNKGREYILDPRFKQQGGSTTNPYTIYMNYINGLDDSETAKNIFDKLNRMHYKDAKEQGMGVANYIATNVISAS